MHTPAIPVNVVGVMEFPAPALSTVANTEMIAFQKLRATATNVVELVVRNVLVFATVSTSWVQVWRWTPGRAWGFSLSGSGAKAWPGLSSELGDLG